MRDATTSTSAEAQLNPPAREETGASQAVTYPCTFPKCSYPSLGVELLYIPPMTWINREVGRRRPVTDWFSHATEREMAEHARCKHHALESVVGLDYNKRHGIDTMSLFCDALKFVQMKRDEAQWERDQARDAYRFRHQQEREERREKREAAKLSRPDKTVAQVSVKPKNYGDARPHTVAVPSNKKKSNKKEQGGGKKGRR